MAINIQEILHPSDSDSIKFSKINYNFDQILANGGGPVGPKGDRGNPGVVGQTGQKGEIGEKGIKGDSGETTSPWKSIAIDLDALDGVNNVTFLKPKPGTDKETPVIWLGDSSFINDGNTAGDGDVTLRSTLNVGRHYSFSNSVVEAEYITLWHDADNKIKIDSENATGYVRYNISPVQPLVGNAPDIRLQINTPTIHTETFQLSNQNASGTLSSGMIRYNSGGQKFEGYINNAWVEFCMDPCGQGGSTDSISISPSGDISANADGTPSGDSISISPSGDVNAQADGSPQGSATTTTTTAATTTTTAASSGSGSGEQQFTIQFSGNSLTNNNWSIDSMVLNAGYAGSASNPSFSYNGSTGVGTLNAVAGDTLRFNITSSAGLNLEFSSGSPFSTTGASVISQQVQQNNTDAGLEIEVTLPMTGTSANVTIEATTQAIVSSTDDFDFVSGQVGGGSITNFGGMTGNLNVTQNGNIVVINFERSSNVAQSNFTLPTWINWSGNSPLTYNGGTNSGALTLSVASNGTGNARSGSVTYNGTILQGNTGAVVIQQDGTVVSGPQGQQY